VSSLVHPGAVLKDAKLVLVAMKGTDMDSEHLDLTELDELQAAYKAAVEAWISAIRNEEALVSANHSMAEIDKWEQAHLDEDDMRNGVKAAKAKYEDALRAKFFGF
jgi:hypothetical protein